MKRILTILTWAVVLLWSWSGTIYALPQAEKTDVVKTLSSEKSTRVLSAENLFITMVDIFAENESIPSSYKYIEVKAPIPKNGKLYKAYQKAIYLDLIPNDGKVLNLSGVATHQKLVEFTEKMFGEKVGNDVLVNGQKLEITKKRILRYGDLVAYAKIILWQGETSSNTGTVSTGNEITSAKNFPILNDVYVRLKTEHIDHANFTDEQLLDGAIKGMTDATGDQYTVFFPPSEAKEFNEDLSGEFEGIGAYVDMEKPGELRIVSPLPGSPAEKAGLKWGDIVTKIGDLAITETITLKEAVAKIKGPTGTSVNLVIKRGNETLNFTVERQKIHVDQVTGKKLDNGDYYIQITTFGEESAKLFDTVFADYVKSGSKKLIIDLRNNPGGAVDAVVDMLSYFVPETEPTLIMRQWNTMFPYFSSGKKGLPSDAKIVVLINSGSASASEIMTGTIKDYLEDRVRILWEKSYGKGSAQSLIPYDNGSALKYTIAKWFTGKSQTSIDKVWISPDTIIVPEKSDIANGIDRVLDAAKNLNF